jgi:VWFA-related protein
MKTIASAALLGACLFRLGTFPLSAQAPQSSPPTTIKSSAEEVLLDVVVRDKKGHLLSDLKPEDFRVFDNGAEKKIVSFRLVQGANAVATGGTRTQLDPLQQVRLVTLIFQCWSNDARRLARDAALDLLKSELPQNVYFSVMTIDHKLEVVQPYTNDVALLRKAIDHVSRSEVKDYSADTAAVQKQLQEMLGPNTSGALTQRQQLDNEQATLAAQGRSADSSDLARVAMAEMVLEMLQTQQSSAATEGGRINIYALLDAVREQYRLPGRKTVLYFSEGGFMIPQGMEQPFKNVISVANRANVSFYSIDTRGLSTSNMNTEAVTALNSAAETSQKQFGDTGQTLSAAQEGERAKALDVALDSTRSNTQNTLANLAESTGGSLVANTNDLRGPLRRVEEDIETYYEIAYAPDIKNYDGSFHTISVKTTSSDMRVQSRAGYFALPPALASGAANLAAYEVLLLSALNAVQPPHDLNYESAAMHYLGAQNEPVCLIAIDVPLANLTFQPTGQGQFGGRLSYVALVKNEKGEVVKKFRNEIPMNIPSSKMQSLKASHFIYTEHFDLAPGKYDLETAVLDSENGNKVSAHKGGFTVLPSSAQLAISSVSFVRDMKDKPASTEPNDPLLVGPKVISPSLAPVVVKGSNSALPFYLVAYGDKAAAVNPKLVMEFSKDGTVLGQAAPELGQPDKDGRIQYVGTVPAASLDPGDYTIRFLLQQGTETAEESASFKVQ